MILKILHFPPHYWENSRYVYINLCYFLVKKILAYCTDLLAASVRILCLFSPSWQEQCCISSVKYIKSSRCCWTTASCSRKLILLVPRIVFIIPVVFVVATVCLRFLLLFHHPSPLCIFSIFNIHVHLISRLRPPAF